MMWWCVKIKTGKNNKDRNVLYKIVAIELR